MSQNMSDKLEQYRTDLQSVEATRANWGQFETWAEGSRRSIRRNIPNELSDFERIVQSPEWVVVPSWGDSRVKSEASRQFGREAAATNDRLVVESKKRLLDFVSELRQLAEQVA